MAAISPGLSMAGPDVVLNPAPISLAIIFERVVFPSPGGPYKRTWSKGSPLFLAASINTLRLFLTLSCPIYVSSVSGLRLTSISLSYSPAAVVIILLSISNTP